MSKVVRKIPVGSSAKFKEEESFSHDAVDFTEIDQTPNAKKTKAPVKGKPKGRPRKVTAKISSEDSSDNQVDNQQSDEPIKGVSITKRKRDQAFSWPTRHDEEGKKRTVRSRRSATTEPPTIIDHSKDTSKFAMEIRTTHGDTIKKIIDNISSLLKTIEIRFFPEGIYICSADIAKYVLITLSLYAGNGFTHYYCPQRYRITVDIAALNNALSSVTNYDTLSFIFQKKDSRNLGLRMETEGRRKKDQVIFGMTSANKVFRVPKQQFSNHMVFKASEFQQDIRSMCYYSAMITFATNKKEFHMMVSGDQGSCHLQLHPEIKNGLEGAEEALPSNGGNTSTSSITGKLEVGSEPVNELPKEEEQKVSLDEMTEDEKRIEENLKKGEEIAAANNGDIDKYLTGDSDDESETGDTEDQEEEKAAPVGANTQVIEDDDFEDFGKPTFDDTYESGLFILRYFHTICKNNNLGTENVEVVFKKGEFITMRYPIENLGYLTFCVMQCNSQQQQ